MDARYMAGPRGVRIVWRDGSHTEVAPHVVVHLDAEHPPARIVGRLYPLRRDGGLAYEAPELQPERTSS